MAVKGRKKAEVPKVMTSSLEVTDAVMGSANALLVLAMHDPVIMAEIEGDLLFPVAWQQDVWNCIQRLYETHSKGDLILVCEELERQGIAPPPGEKWLPLLGALMRDSAAVARNAKHYAETLSKWQRRTRCAEVGRTLFMSALSGEDGSDEAIRDLMAMSTSARQLDGPLAESMSEVVDDLDAKGNLKEGEIPGLPYGITALDNNTGGMGDEHLIVLAARPSMGKTALALNVAWASAKQKIPVGFISTEQPRREMIKRLVSIVGDVDSHHIRLGKLTDEEWVKATAAFAQLSDAPIYMNDKPAPHIYDIVRQARKWKHRYGIRLLIVDYIQRVRTDADRRHEEVGEVARTLKNIARELRIPVLALSQISREVDRRENKEPNMSDLRESGDIEQEADGILFLYRPEVYYNDDKYAGRAKIINAKNRHGPIGKVDCAFVASYLRFEDFTLDGGELDPPEQLLEAAASRAGHRASRFHSDG